MSEITNTLTSRVLICSFVKLFLVSLGVMIIESAIAQEERRSEFREGRSAEESEEPDLEVVDDRIKEDIEDATRELNNYRGKTSQEQKELLTAINQLENDVSSLENKLRQSKVEDERLGKEIDGLEAEIKQKEASLEYISDSLLEFRQNLPEDISGAMQQKLASRLSEIDETLDNPDGEESAGALSKLLDQDLLAELAAPDDGIRFSGKAVTNSGEIVRGRYAVFGPLNFFADDTGSVVGISHQQPGTLHPAVFQNLKQKEKVRIADFIKAGEGTVPVDVSGGKGLELRQAETGIIAHLKQGRIVMLPLLTLAAICVVIALYKFVQLVRITNSVAEEQIHDIVAAVRSGDITKAFTVCDEKLRKPLRAVLREGINCRGSSKEHIEELMYEKLISQTPSLERFLAPLAVCASAAPLLGLLGTVTGMIHTFRLITVFGTGDAQTLSSGISEALVTTEVGLIVAIPALLIHAYLSRRVRRSITLTQQAATIFLNGLKLRDEN